MTGGDEGSGSHETSPEKAVLTQRPSSTEEPSTREPSDKPSSSDLRRGGRTRNKREVEDLGYNDAVILKRRKPTRTGGSSRRSSVSSTGSEFETLKVFSKKLDPSSEQVAVNWAQCGLPSCGKWRIITPGQFKDLCGHKTKVTCHSFLRTCGEESDDISCDTLEKQMQKLEEVKTLLEKGPQHAESNASADSEGPKKRVAKPPSRTISVAGFKGKVTIPSVGEALNPLKSISSSADGTSTIGPANPTIDVVRKFVPLVPKQNPAAAPLALSNNAALLMSVKAALAKSGVGAVTGAGPASEPVEHPVEHPETNGA